MADNMSAVSKDEMAQRFQQNWREQNPDDNCLPDVDDCLTNLNWLQNLNIMTKIGAPTPETPPASPVPSPEFVKGTTFMDRSCHGSASSKNGKSASFKAVLEDVDYKTNGTVKPPYSYATLICMAMKANKNKMTLSAIYKWIKENFMYYKNADPSWQNSIRHNLSLNKCFIKIPRSKDEPGKGGFWRLDPEYAESLVDGIFKKRRPAQRQPGGSGGGLSKKSRKDKAKEPFLTDNAPAPSIPTRDATYQQDTPPSSAGSMVSNGGELDLMIEMKHSPTQQAFNYVHSGGICDYQTDVIFSTHQSGDQQPHLHRSQIQTQMVVDDDEVLMTLEPITHELVTCEMTHGGGNTVNTQVANGLYPGMMCWNEVLDPELELESSLYKYRPEDSISTVVNTALSLNDDLFSSDGSTPDLANELDLATACTDQLGIGNNAASLPPNDWWACFQNNPLDVPLAPSLLSISSVPFQNSQSNGTVTYPNSACRSAYNTTTNSNQILSERQLSLQEVPVVVNQVWADCKVNLDAATLDLDDLGDLDPVHAY